MGLGKFASVSEVGEQRDFRDWLTDNDWFSSCYFWV